MNDGPPPSGILFLLASMPLACAVDGSGVGTLSAGEGGGGDVASATDTTGATGSQTSTTGGEATTHASTGMDRGDSGSSASADDGVATGGETAAELSGGPATASTTGADEEACIAYGELLGGCEQLMQTVDYWTGLCETMLAHYEDAYGPECVLVAIDYYACVGTLDCAEFGAGACNDVFMAMQDVCLG